MHKQPSILAVDLPLTTAVSYLIFQSVNTAICASNKQLILFYAKELL